MASAAREVLLADAITAELNDSARGWTIEFEAKRLWLPDYSSSAQTSDLATLKVAVVPLTLVGPEPVSRAANQREYGIAIDLQKQVGTADIQGADALSLLAESICDFYADWHYLSGTGIPATTYKVMGVSRNDIYDITRLDQDQVWETLIVVTVRGIE